MSVSVPHGWRESTLKEVCASIVDGTHYTPSYVPQGIPFYSVESLTRDDFTNVKYISLEEHRRLTKRCRPMRGDILMTRIGSLGDTKLIDWDVDASIYVSLALLRPGRFVDGRYLYAYTKSGTFLKDVEDRSLLWAAPKKINMGDLGRVPICMPIDINEQRAIGEVLTDLESSIRALQKLIVKKRAIKQGMMQELLTGEMRLPGFTTPWHKTSLGQVSRIKTGSRNNQDKVNGGRYPFFVRSATIERINTYSYDCEAILVPGEGGIGSIFHYVDGKFEVHQRVYKISDFHRVVGKYVYHYMRQYFGPHAMENSVKATVDSLRLPTFKSFEITIPADLDEQKAIVGALDDADSEITAFERRLEATHGIKKSMMQELLTGRTRLVPTKGVA